MYQCRLSLHFVTCLHKMVYHSSQIELKKRDDANSLCSSCAYFSSQAALRCNQGFVVSDRVVVAYSNGGHFLNFPCFLVFLRLFAFWKVVSTLSVAQLERIWAKWIDQLKLHVSCKSDCASHQLDADAPSFSLLEHHIIHDFDIDVWWADVFI